MSTTATSPAASEGTIGARRALRTLTSRYVVFDVDDVDTDQIIPARFLTTTQREGLGKFAFFDRRQATTGTTGFPLDAADAKGAEVLVVGRNFGCGSSREHAVWALMDLGIRAVIGISFADIFRGNAHANGLLPVALPEPVVRALMAQRAADPTAQVVVDLKRTHVIAPGHDGDVTSFAVPPFARHCMLNGLDELAFLLDAEDARVAYEQERRTQLDTRAALQACEASV